MKRGNLYEYASLPYLFFVGEDQKKTTYAMLGSWGYLMSRSSGLWSVGRIATFRYWNSRFFWALLFPCFVWSNHYPFQRRIQQSQYALQGPFHFIEKTIGFRDDTNEIASVATLAGWWWRSLPLSSKKALRWNTSLNRMPFGVRNILITQLVLHALNVKVVLDGVGLQQILPQKNAWIIVLKRSRPCRLVHNRKKRREFI